MTLPPRLSSRTLNLVPAEVLKPTYRRSEQKSGIVHFGVGAFHRAHQALCFDTLMNAGVPDWGITGVSMRSGSVPALLNPQDGLYTVIEREGDNASVRVVGALQNVLQAGAQSAQIIRTLADPDVTLVTITVTEKGYCLNAATGQLDPDHSAVSADLASPQCPASLPGLLVAGLAARKADGLDPLTILSCDNLAHNGGATRNAVLGFADLSDPSLSRWIESECTFPSSMVDRIVPATTKDDVARLAQRLGYRDEGMVNTEPFLQWVIEDSFATRRPPLDLAGAAFAGDVTAWEMAKLRLLNGAHSALAYLGALAGFEFVHEAIAFDPLRAYIERLWDEQAATLPELAGFDSRAYRRDLIRRFRNPALNHRTRQIATDGSQKLPQRLIMPLRERRKEGLACENQYLAIAAWMRWQLGTDDLGNPYTVDDPLANLTRDALNRSGHDAKGGVAALLSIDQIFGTELLHDDVAVDGLTRSVDELLTYGSKETLSRRI